MVKFEMEDGRRFVLMSHTPGEWAEIVLAQLRRVGCSDEHAEAVAAQIRAAKPV